MICKACSQDKEPDAFYTMRGKPASPCKRCHNQRSRTWYKNNRERHQKLVRRWHVENPDTIRTTRQKLRQRLRATVEEIKSKTPCADCGAKLPPWVMDFDHRPGEEKVADVSRMASRNGTLTQLRREIEKCDVVCAVCHAHRTYCREHNIEWYQLI